MTSLDTAPALSAALLDGVSVSVDVSPLRRRIAVLTVSSGALGALAICFLALALGFAPGGGAMWSIDLSPDAIGVLDHIGIKHTVAQHEIVGGVNLRSLRGWGIWTWVIVLLAIGDAVRRRWWNLAILAGLVAGSILVGAFLHAPSNYDRAEIQEFNIANGEPSSSLSPDFVRAHPEFAQSANPYTRKYDQEMHDQWAARVEHAAEFERLLAHPPPTLSPAQVDALHYIEAQLAYLRLKPDKVAQELNRLRPGVFRSDPYSDWLIRDLWRDAEESGQRPAPHAYRPNSGVSFRLLAGLARLLGLIGLLFWAAASIVGEMRRSIAKRLDRLPKLMEKLRPGATACEDQPVGGSMFGRRAAA